MSILVPSNQIFTPELLIPGRTPFGITEINPSHPLARGLVGWWRLDEGSGSNTYDASGNGNDGTLTNMDPTTDWVTGHSGTGYALDFDGSNDCVNIGSDSSLDVSLPVSVSFWAKKDTSATMIVFANDIDSSDDNYRGVYAGVTGDKPFILYGDGTGSTGTARRQATSDDTMDNSWHHVVCIMRGATDADIYIDGSSVSGITYSGTGGSIAYGTNPGYLGRRNSLTPDWEFDGKMDDVRIYDCELSAYKILLLYRDPYSLLRFPGPEYLPFDAGATTISIPSVMLQHNHFAGGIGL